MIVSFASPHKEYALSSEHFLPERRVEADCGVVFWIYTIWARDKRITISPLHHIFTPHSVVFILDIFCKLSAWTFPEPSEITIYNRIGADAQAWVGTGFASKRGNELQGFDELLRGCLKDEIFPLEPKELAVSNSSERAPS